MIGTRRSKLARWQAETIATAIRSMANAPDVELVFISTEGDRVTDAPLHTIAGKAFFTKEIESALLDGKIDIAVHSLKDLATEMPTGLSLGAVLEREDPRDALVALEGQRFADLPHGARVGTSSLRRRAQLLKLRPDLKIADLRGNVPTRIARLEAGDYHAIVLAAAGLLRLGLSDHISEYFSTDRMLPAVSQGAVAVQLRADDAVAARWIHPLDHAPTRVATTAERAFLRALEGGCQIPVAALGTVKGESLTLRGTVCSLDGRRAVSGSASGSADGAEAVGVNLASQLARQGATEILDAIRTVGQHS